MADKTTSWILELVDRLTEPAKKIMGSVRSINESIDDMNETVNYSEKETREALTKSKEYYKDLETQIKEVENELKSLDKQKKSDNWSEQIQAQKAFEKAEEKVNRLREALTGAKQDIDQLTDRSENFAKSAQKWSDIAIGVNQGIELIQKATDALDFTVDVATLTSQVQRMTDLSGKALDEFVAKSRSIASVYREDAEEIARAANAMTKQNGGSYQDNLKLIEEGFKRGGNINKDFLDQLKEYQPFIKQLGLTQSQAIAMIAKSGKDGIYSDKAIDSLKEANMALREMGKSQIDALAGIGIKPEDLVGKTTFEAIQLISQKMKGATSQAKQLILADIFKGAGEDAGIKWAEELGNANFDLTSLPSVEESGSKFKTWLSNISTWAGQAFGSVGVYAQELSPMIQAIAGAIPIYQMLSKVTWIQSIASHAATAAQWLWNAALTANPIGIVIVAIGLLVGALVWLSKSTEGWGQAWTHTLEAGKNLFLAWVESVKSNFNLLVNGLMIGINKIQEGWYKFKDALGIGDSKENQKMLGQIQADTEERKKSIKEGYQKAAEYGLKARDEMQAAIGSVKLKKEQNKKSSPSVNDYALMAPDTLGSVAQETTKNNKGKSQGLDFSGGGNGVRSINMTLNMTNNFSVSKGDDIRSIADKIIGHVNDRLRDSVINLAT